MVKYNCNDDKEDIVSLICEPVKQQEWYKQYTEHFRTISSRRRAIDRLSIAEIAELYDNNKTICDECGRDIELYDNDAISNHVLRIINPTIWFTCDDCLEKDFQNGCIIGHAK